MKQSISTRLLLVAFLLLFVAMSAFAQQSTAVTGGLNGVVTDSSGAVVPGATVTLIGPQGKTVLTTDSIGRFSKGGLTPGFYDVLVVKTGFKKIESKHNEVRVDSSSTLNLSLTVGDTGGEVVEVSASAVSIDTQSTAIVSTLTDTFYESIPMARNVAAIFYAAPGVASGQVAGAANQAGPGASNPSIGGASGLENLYVVDGVTITDQAYGGIGTYSAEYGAIGTGINLAYIKEVDIKTFGFEPQYGKATGGIVQIVTKSGGNAYHGAIGAYFAPESWFASPKRFQDYNYQLAIPTTRLASPQYDVSGELGGYIPGFKDKLFFFGAVDPSLSRTITRANTSQPTLDAATIAHGKYTYSTTTIGWAGKVTYKITPSTLFEASSFGDPSRRNNNPATLATNFPLSLSSAYHYGSRDSIARLNSTITSTWVADASYTYAHSHFDEYLAQNQYEIIDNSGSPFHKAATTSGFGDTYPTKNDTYSIAFNTSKTINALGQHTLSVGYEYDHTNFLNIHNRSGAMFPLPITNEAGTTIPVAANRSDAPGSLSNAIFRVSAANSANPSDPTCTACTAIPSRDGSGGTEYVYASVYRGSYSGFNTLAKARYHAAYGNEVWRMNRYVSINAGMRWETERIIGQLANYNFHPSWSPRIGINIDPFGDKRSKVFFNFGRNYWFMPLDAAIRQLGNEQDDTGYAFAPQYNASTGLFTVTPTTAYNLNGLPKATSPSTGAVSNFARPNFSSSSAEGILGGTKQEYEDEYVIGWERELPHSVVMKARFSYRQLGRIIEDIGSQSPEGSQIAGNYEGGIANPGKNTDIAVNEQEYTYTSAQYVAKNPAGSTTYTPPIPQCAADGSNDTGNIFIDGKNNPVGGACFTNLATMDGRTATAKNGRPIGDGIPDGFVDAVRDYKAWEVEIDKRFSNNWLAVFNYRYGSLYGNYEGAYRNDNGQADPGISSLFDFTTGDLNLLGDQFKRGYLSTDRRQVMNGFLSYVIGNQTPYLKAAKGLTVGAGVRFQTGVPLSLLGDHPVYLNQGEVPIGGRGAAGRTPMATQLDLHSEYSVPLGAKLAERWKVKFAMDFFNVFNSKPETGRVQYTQLANSAVGAVPTLDSDYGKPTSFQGAFYARGQLRIEF